MSNNSIQKVEYESLNGLRGIAVLMVLFTHGGLVVASSDILPTVIGRFLKFGKYGVVIFFLLSSFTIFHSIYSRGFNLKDYLVRRIFRILPLYYLMCIVALLLGGCVYYLNLFNVQADINNLISHLLFLNYFDKRYQNSLIGVEWTIPIEVIFYIFIPIVFLLYKKNRKSLNLVMIITFLISYFSLNISAKISTLKDSALFDSWSITPYIFTYSLGIWTYIISLKKKIVINSWGLLLLIASLLIAIGANIEGMIEKQAVIFIISIFTALLIYISINRNTLSIKLFENKFAVFIGKISYSLYLVHFLVFLQLNISGVDTFIAFIIKSLLSIGIASIIYFTYEKYTINLGKKFLTKKANI